MDTADRKAIVPCPNERHKAEGGRVEIGIRGIAASSIRTGRNRRTSILRVYQGTLHGAQTRGGRRLERWGDAMR